MKKTLAFLTVLVLIFVSACALADEKPAPTAEPAHTPGPSDIIITEESGGEFRPIPIEITNGGAPLPKSVRYDSKMNIYQDPTIRVERHTGYSSYWKCNYYYMLIEIKDPWFGIFYLDASENPEAYDGKTVRFKGQIYRGRNLGRDEFVPGRMAMVCCAEDVRFVGFIAKGENGEALPKEKSWQTVTALVRAEERREYKGPGPVLYVQHMEPAEAPEEEVVNFNR